MRCVRRRNDATDRSRTSSAVSAVTSVRRPRCFGAPARGAFGAAAGRTGAPPTPRRAGRRSSSSASGVIDARAVSRAPLLPRRQSASWRPRRPCAWSPRRDGGALPRCACAPRPPRARSGRSRRARARIFASSSAILRSSASRTLASPSAWARRLCSSSVSVRSTTPEGFCGGAAGARRCCGCSSRHAARDYADAARRADREARRGVSAGFASPGPTWRLPPSRPPPPSSGRG